MKTQQLFFLSATLLFAVAASAQTTTPCKPGFLPDECAAFERYQAEKAEKELKQSERAKKEQESYEADKRREADERNKRIAEMDAARTNERARQKAELDRVEATQDSYEREATAQQQRRDAQAKAKCGTDFKTPRIGMTMDRVRECVSTSFKLVGQTNTDQGVVTTYRAPGGYLHVIEGKVVQWGKF